MIRFINGTLEYTSVSGSIVIEAGGIGYEVFVGLDAIKKMPVIGDQIKIYTYMQVKEDGISLFGFLTRNELEMFHKLIMVNGIGPKVASGIVSHFDVDKIVLAIVAEDAELLSKAPGVGKKTALRIIMELKDKFRMQDAIDGYIGQQEIKADISGGARRDAIEALSSLGFSQSEATKAVLAVFDEKLNTEQLIKLALKKLTV